MAQQRPSFGKKLRDLYKLWTLDCISYLGYAISKDFSKRPELYKNVKDANNLTDIQSLYGYNSDFPNDEIRQMLTLAIFGASDGLGNGNDGSAFQTYRMPVLAAAADFSENAQPTGFPMLRERIRSAIVPFKTHLVDLEGSSFNQTAKRIAAIFDMAQGILKDPDVFMIFGINGKIDSKWPLESNDSQGAKLIEKITSQLSDIPHGVILREQFVRIQRIADEGAKSLQIIVDQNLENPNFDIDNKLITPLYAWGSDLGLIGGTRPQAK